MVPKREESEPKLNGDSVLTGASVLNENDVAAGFTVTLSGIGEGVGWLNSLRASSIALLNSSASSLVLNLTVNSSGVGSFSEKSVAAQLRDLSLRLSNVMSVLS